MSNQCFLWGFFFATIGFYLFICPRITALWHSNLWEKYNRWHNVCSPFANTGDKGHFDWWLHIWPFRSLENGQWFSSSLLCLSTGKVLSPPVFFKFLFKIPVAWEDPMKSLENWEYFFCKEVLGGGLGYAEEGKSQWIWVLFFLY